MATSFCTHNICVLLIKKNSDYLNLLSLHAHAGIEYLPRVVILPVNVCFKIKLNLIKKTYITLIFIHVIYIIKS